MATAFGISDEDIDIVLEANASRINEDKDASTIFAALDHGEIEKAALKASIDLDEQTVAAHENIAKQLEQLGYLLPADTLKPDRPQG